MIDNDGNQRPLPEGCHTDVIISQYESLLNKSIASKALALAQKGTIPTYTKEEMAYLTKKAVDETFLSEVKVITPSPTITLKKGSTEINVKNAATLLHRMEERYPTPSSIKYTDPERKIDVVGDIDDEPAQRIYPERERERVQTVNKNAYEIRADILSQALAWVQYKRNFKPALDPIPTEDDVLAIANKFYRFVENRR